MQSARQNRLRSILFVNQYYYPDRSGTSQLLQQLAEDLVGRGFRVSVLTGNSRHDGGRLTSHRRGHFRGVSILEVPSCGFGKATLIGQALDYISFHLFALFRILFLRRFDIVVTLTTPPLIAWIGCFARVFKKSRFLYWVQDLYPEVAAALGTLSCRSILFKLASRISGHALRSADGVIAVGEVMEERLRPLVASPGALRVIHNWADPDWLATIPPEQNSFLKKQALQGKTVVLYSGNLGRAHLFGEILHAAGALRDVPGLEFVLIGSGRQENDIVARIRRHRLSHVRILPAVPYDQLSEVLSSATIGVVTQKRETAGLLVPSKLYGLMATARPVLYLGPGACEAARIIRDIGCGYALEPGDSGGVVEAIREVIADPCRAGKMGRSGYQWFMDHATRSHAAGRFKRLLDELLQPNEVQGRQFSSFRSVHPDMRRTTPTRINQAV